MVDPGDLLTTVASLGSATKSIADAIQALRAKAKGNAEAEKLASTALDQILSLQTRMVQVQQQVFSLQEDLAKAKSENGNLRAQIRAEEEWAAERKHYSRKDIGGTWVMVREGEEDGVYYCPRCFQKSGQGNLLQQTPFNFQVFGQFQCSVCKGYF